MTDQTAADILRAAADTLDRTDLPEIHVDLFDNGATWAANQLRRMADEAAAAGVRDEARQANGQQPATQYLHADGHDRRDRGAVVPPEGYGEVFVPTLNDMVVEIYGVLIDANEDVLFAVTPDERRAVAALNCYHRTERGFCGPYSNLLDDRAATYEDARQALTRQNVVFTRSLEPDEYSWRLLPVPVGTPGSLTVFSMEMR